MAHGADARAQQCAECQALEPLLVGQAVALEAFKAQALMLCSTPDCLAVALEALVALALMLSSMTGLISLPLAPLLEDHAATACHTFYLEGVLRLHKFKFALYIIGQFGQTGMS